jgi:hypothetical protein
VGEWESGRVGVLGHCEEAAVDGRTTAAERHTQAALRVSPSLLTAGSREGASLRPRERASLSITITITLDMPEPPPCAHDRGMLERQRYTRYTDNIGLHWDLLLLSFLISPCE